MHEIHTKNSFSQIAIQSEHAPILLQAFKNFKEEIMVIQK